MRVPYGGYGYIVHFVIPMVLYGANQRRIFSYPNLFAGTAVATVP